MEVTISINDMVIRRLELFNLCGEAWEIREEHGRQPPTPIAKPRTSNLISAQGTTEGARHVPGNWSAEHKIQIWLREPLPHKLGQSHLNIYVPMYPWAVTPMSHVAVPQMIRQCKHRFMDQFTASPYRGSLHARVYAACCFHCSAVINNKIVHELWITAVQP